MKTNPHLEQVFKLQEVIQKLRMLQKIYILIMVEKEIFKKLKECYFIN